MNQIKFKLLLAFLFQLSCSISQQPEKQQLHFYYGKDKKSNNTLDMEFHGDTLLYFRPESTSYSYYTDTVYEESGEMRIRLNVSRTIIVPRLFLEIRVLWKSSDKKDSITYEMISKKWIKRKGEYEIKVVPHQLYFEKEKESLGCMFPSQLNRQSDFYMYDPEKSHIVTKYEGKKWFFLFGKLKRSYKYRYYYYDRRDTTQLLWFHDLYLDKKNKLPLVLDEAPVYTMAHENGTQEYVYTINRRIQYRRDGKKGSDAK